MVYDFDSWQENFTLVPFFPTTSIASSPPHLTSMLDFRPLINPYQHNQLYVSHLFKNFRDFFLIRRSPDSLDWQSEPLLCVPGSGYVVAKPRPLVLPLPPRLCLLLFLPVQGFYFCLLRPSLWFTSLFRRCFSKKRSLGTQITLMSLFRLPLCTLISTPHNYLLVWVLPSSCFILCRSFILSAKF